MAGQDGEVLAGQLAFVDSLVAAEVELSAAISAKPREALQGQGR